MADLNLGKLTIIILLAHNIVGATDSTIAPGPDLSFFLC